MKRRNFISSLLAASAIGVNQTPAAQIAPRTNCSLLPFQKHILSKINQHNKCLFWMPRGSAKTWLISQITGQDQILVAKEGRNKCIEFNGIHFYDDTFAPDIHEDKNEKIVILATPNKDITVNNKIFNMGWDYIESISIDKINETSPIIYDKNLLADAKKSMTKERFDREFMANPFV